jgi:hypothetical protein
MTCISSIKKIIGTGKFKQNKYAIVKCTIPKGSKYYVGIYRNRRSIVSNCIVYNEIIN